MKWRSLGLAAACLCLGFAVGCEVEPEVDGAPTVLIVSPEDGARVASGGPIVLRAELGDDRDAPQSLLLSLVLDGQALSLPSAWEGDTVIFDLEGLSSGEHTVMLIALDTAGQTGDAVVQFTVNAAPTAPIPSISPSAPTSADSLEVNLEGEVVDGDGPASAVTTTVGWTRDGAPWLDDNGVSVENWTVPAEATTRGEVWRAEVTVDDGLDTVSLLSAPVTIGNSPPPTPEPVLVPETPDLASTLGCSVDMPGEDADGDTWVVRVHWRIGEVDVPDLEVDEISVVALAAAAGSPIAAGDTVTCVLSLDDGVDTVSGEAQVLVDDGELCPTGEAPCSPLATCEDNGTTSPLCTCPEGYDGDGETCLWVDPCESFPCQNGGICAVDGFGFVCACPEAYEGDLCEIYLDPCDADPCENGGVCLPWGASFSCACPEGWLGAFCEIYDDPCEPSPCKNEGVCVSEDLTFTCDCLPGYGGDFCEVYLDPCVVNPCENGGVCEAAGAGVTCACPDGYEGSYCEVLVDPCEPDPCMNGGKCQADGLGFDCVCPAAYSGVICQVYDDPCEPNPCLNGGLCDADGGAEFVCTCSELFEGATCDTPVTPCDPNPCQNDGTCEADGADFSCTCPEDVTGAICQTDLAPCAPNPCQNGGMCEPAGFEYACKCPVGWGGLNCDVPDAENSCEPNPCQNGGTCFSAGTIYHCLCAEGYTSTTCNACAAGFMKEGDVCVPDPDCPVCVDAVAPTWQLMDIEPESAGYLTEYGLYELPSQVTVMALLVGW